MYESLTVEIAKRRADLEDAEFFLECVLASHEDSDQWETEEARLARQREDSLADMEIKRKLDSLEFGDRATRRLDYLLGLAVMLIGCFHRKRALSLAEEIQRREADPGAVN
jgi:hypothetical protein